MCTSLSTPQNATSTIPSDSAPPHSGIFQPHTINRTSHLRSKTRNAGAMFFGEGAGAHDLAAHVWASAIRLQAVNEDGPCTTSGRPLRFTFGTMCPCTVSYQSFATISSMNSRTLACSCSPFFFRFLMQHGTKTISIYNSAAAVPKHIFMQKEKSANVAQ